MPDLEDQFRAGIEDEIKQYPLLIEELRQELEWDGSPYMVSFNHQIPSGIPHISSSHAACAMWKEAQEGPVYATPADLEACAMGADLLFQLSANQQVRYEEMIHMGERYGWNPHTAKRWFDRLPRIRFEEPLAAIVYAPLALAPCEPDVIFLIVDPNQAKLLDYAASFQDGEASPVATAGPACAFICRCFLENRTTFGWGDMSLRFFFDLPKDRMFAAIPGRQLRFILRNLKDMKKFYGTIDDIQAKYQMSLDYFAGGEASY